MPSTRSRAAFGRVARELTRDVDDAARVGDEVRCVHDAEVGERLAGAVVDELVVRRAAHRAAPQPSRAVVGDDPAERARRHHVALEIEHVVDVGDLGAVLVGDGLGALRR